MAEIWLHPAANKYKHLHVGLPFVKHRGGRPYTWNSATGVCACISIISV